MSRRTNTLLGCSVALAWGCNPGGAAQAPPPGAAPSPPHEAMQLAPEDPHAAAGSDTLALVPEVALREPGALWLVRSAVVFGRTGPDGRPFEVALRTADAPHARSFGRRTLLIALRTDAAAVMQYPCTSCHAGSRVDMADERIADAHADIAMTHPREVGATCATCHSGADVELLTLRTGERASLDHAYRVCAQCHFSQADAWAAGAHGKRLDGWQGRRVVMGCTDCHDPHAPALHRRLPFRPPTLHRPGSLQR